MKLPHNPTHPGEILLEEFLNPLEITQSALAEHIGVPFKRVNEIIKGKRSVTPDTAWLLSQAFGNSPEFWMGLQTTYDLVHKKTDRKVKRINMKKAS
ncbi:MAG: HigA family addiction module antitoxin [Planctomycetota bacterium]|jgi:addiction module HigA family antidote